MKTRRLNKFLAYLWWSYTALLSIAYIARRRHPYIHRESTDSLIPHGALLVRDGGFLRHPQVQEDRQGRQGPRCQWSKVGAASWFGPFLVGGVRKEGSGNQTHETPKQSQSWPMVGRWQTYWINMAHGIPYSNTVTSGLSYMYVHSRQIFYCDLQPHKIQSCSPPPS